jgi:hypothetical protein
MVILVDLWADLGMGKLVFWGVVGLFMRLRDGVLRTLVIWVKYANNISWVWWHGWIGQKGGDFELGPLFWGLWRKGWISCLGDYYCRFGCLSRIFTTSEDERWERLEGLGLGGAWLPKRWR